MIHRNVRYFVVVFGVLVHLVACSAPPETQSVGQDDGVKSPVPATSVPATDTPALPTDTKQPEPTVTAAPAVISLTSSSFPADGDIPATYACPTYGDNLSPALAWEAVPAGTKSLALIVTDPDAGMFTHWLVANIPADVAGFEAGQVPPGAVEGVATTGSSGWFGPCPPDTVHRYVFTLYALDIQTDLEADFGLIDFRMAMQGHIIGEGTVTGRFTP